MGVGILSLLLSLATVEAILRLGTFDGSELDWPVWISTKFRRLDAAINAKYERVAAGNPFGFNDRPRSPTKAPGVTRIAILGDSFVWGDGVPYDVTWSHKLEAKLTHLSNRLEVVSWGKRGWSTLDEFDFLRQAGIELDADLLVVGFVTNDPDFGDRPLRRFTWQHGRIWRAFGALLPEFATFFPAFLNAILGRASSGYGYASWERHLYSRQNMRRYGELLDDLAAYCRSRHLSVLFVLTWDLGVFYPAIALNRTHHRHDEYYQIIPLLEAARLPYLDTYPAVVERLRGVRFRSLWANPANPHPGNALTEVYADVVFRHLVDTGAIARMLDRSAPVPSGRSDGGGPE